MTTANQLLGVPYFGASGTVEASALPTRVFKAQKNVQLQGFSGLMLVITEDEGLAAALAAQFDIRALLTYSSVCGFNFTVNFNYAAYIPYFPAGYHHGKRGNAIVFGLETPDLLAAALPDWKSSLHLFHQSSSSSAPLSSRGGSRKAFFTFMSALQ